MSDGTGSELLAAACLRSSIGLSSPASLCPSVEQAEFVSDVVLVERIEVGGDVVLVVALARVVRCGSDIVRRPGRTALAVVTWLGPSFGANSYRGVIADA